MVCFPVVVWNVYSPWLLVVSAGCPFTVMIIPWSVFPVTGSFTCPCMSGSGWTMGVSCFFPSSVSCPFGRVVFAVSVIVAGVYSVVL